MDKLFHLAKKVCNEANEFFNQISSSVDPKIINHKSKIILFLTLTLNLKSLLSKN